MTHKIRFAVYRSSSVAAPQRVGEVVALTHDDAYRDAKDTFGEGPFILRMLKTRNEVTAYIRANGFQKGQDRIGLAVYRAPVAGRRAKSELAVGADMMHLYDLQDGRRKLAQSWELTA